MTICLLANPAAGSGRGARAIATAERALAQVDDIAVMRTTRAGDEARLVRDALDAGHGTIAVLGGDGTWSKVASALVANGGGARMALLAAGTGNDLARSLDTPARDYAATARLIGDGIERTIDVGRVDDDVFVNVAGFGFDAAVLDVVQRTPWLTGATSYAVAALRELFAYHGFDAAIAGDGSSGPTRRWLGIFLANGACFGGGFRIAPNASLADGRLDVVTLGDASAWRRARLFAAATRGAHVGMREVGAWQARETVLDFPAPPRYEADGDLRRARASRVVVSTLPHALRVVAPDAR